MKKQDKKAKKAKKCKGQEDLFPHIQIQYDRFPGITVVKRG
jgi:hypothetical protein